MTSLPAALTDPQWPRSLVRQIRRGRDLVSGDDPAGIHEVEADVFATRLADVDRLLDGGICRGQTIELVGPRSSGRFSLVLEILAGATEGGESAALVDLGDHFDPQAAARAGVVLERLLWARPRRLKQALGSAEVLIGGGFPLVVLDLGLPPVPGGRGKESAWLRLRRAADDHQAALLIATPYRAGGTAPQKILDLGAPVRALWAQAAPRSPRLLDGLVTRLELAKSRGERPGAAAEVELRVLTGSLRRPLPGAPPRRTENRHAAGTPVEVLRRAG
ncbi:MAG: hypothetical protein OXG74_03285 [Acidobacteria bacterium]|nr:hypothetical protein [Acidobacteriota bacterium]